MKQIRVKSLLPVRLDKYIMEQYPALKPGLLNKALRENKIKLNGKKQPLSTRVQAGDEIKLFITDDILMPEQVSDGPDYLSARYEAEVVFEDDNILLVNKPAGVPVESDEAQGDSLYNRACLHLHKQGCTPAQIDSLRLCHRLDTGTSGLLILAKNAEVENIVTGWIKDHRIRKKYVCVTFGRPVPEEATLNGYLTKDAAKGRVFIDDEPRNPTSKEIETQYKTIAISGRLALLEVELITGRTHQIRAHMASIGCPILGDSKYGNNNANRELKLRYQALCAYELQFPPSQEPTLAGIAGKTFRAPKPWYFNQILDHTLK